MTGRPIDILTGAKQFFADDFSTADGVLRARRYYNSMYGASGDTVVDRPLGLATWTFDFALELHLGPAWSSGQAALLTPRGGLFRFVKSGSVMTPHVTSTYPLPRTDYTLEHVGTWPGTLAAVKDAKSNWIVRDAEDRTWYLQSFRSPSSGDYSVARPVRIVEASGVEYSLVYDAFGALFSITDTYGRKITFDWITVDQRPLAVSVARLPDGTRLEYRYESLASAAAFYPDRLTGVERRAADGTLLDKTTYAYADPRFAYFITSISDRDGVLRWSVTYDDEGRAVESKGPGGVGGDTVAYGAMGTTFTRTVTNALGKSAVYTFTRSSTSVYDIKLESVAGQASAHCPASTAGATHGPDDFVASETDEEGRVTAYTRDAKGRPTQVVEAQGTADARTTGITWHSAVSTPTQVASPGLTVDLTLAAVTSAGEYVPPPYAATQAFAYSGAADTYVAPPGASSVTVELWGGAGGNGNYNAGAWSGTGGYVKATFAVTPGDVLKVEVGGGGQGAMRNADGGAGGWPDGGSGAKGSSGSGGGGGSTRFYINGNLKAVAGGGGGSGGYAAAGIAGAGGGKSAQSATGGGGTGGSQTAPGVDLSAPSSGNKAGRSLVAYPGAQRTGGWGASNGTSTTTTTDDGGGGGGGYWGGGGGGGGSHAGGGGSSWVDPSATDVMNFGGNRQTPFSTPSGLPTVATGVNSAANGPAVAGGDGHAILGLR